jgi:alpha-glucosidase
LRSQIAVYGIGMKRREFLATGASAALVAALPRAAPVRGAPRGPAWESHPVGDFILQRAGRSLRVAHRQNPDRILWQSAPDGNFIIAESAAADVRAFGTPQGSFDIKDRVSASYQRPSIGAIELGANRATVSGKFATGEVGYSLNFEAISPTHLRFEIRTEASEAAKINRIRLRIESVADEGFFGFGQQLTYFNQKGNTLPILVQEHGVGRGQPILTRLVDLLAEGGGRDPYVTEAPAPHFISSRLRSLFLENTEYSVFNMRAARHAEIKVWSGVMTGRILFGDTPLDLIEAYTEYAGRMRVMPDWIHNGAIVASQGGMEAARKIFDECVKADVPLAGMWMQDWVGIRITFAGQQLWWNWRLDESYYPQWHELAAALEKRGGRMLIYINPFLCNTEGHDELFKEAAEKGYLVKTAAGAPYLIKNTTFFAGLIDLSNPGTRTWIKGIIKDVLIGKVGASGWMCDFGEALPFDSKLYSGADPAVWHNRYPEEWAKVNREAIEEAGRGDDIVFFNRSGFTQSPKFSTMFWLGDQLESWDQYDGIKSAVVGMLSGGVSGFSLLHSDIGGYTSLALTVAGRKIPIVFRSNELLQRWMELGAFTVVFRTHEGLDTAIAAQVDSNPANMAHLARFAKIYKGLAAYRKSLVAEATEKGHPVVRPLFLHYPDDPRTHELRYQFLLGADLLVAPVLDKGADEVGVYFPASSAWIDLWSGAETGTPGAWSTKPAPLGKPAVFLRKGAPSADQILAGLKSVGILT